jgi:hypothetical protein
MKHLQHKFKHLKQGLQHAYFVIATYATSKSIYATSNMQHPNLLLQHQDETLETRV